MTKRKNDDNDFLGGALCWFRNDLRTHDNRALNSSIDYFNSSYKHTKNSSIIALYIYDQKEFKERNMATCKIKFIENTLIELHKKLEIMGIPLIVDKSNRDPLEIITDLCKKCNLKAIFCNRESEPYGRKRDERIRQLISKNNEEIGFNEFGTDQCIIEEGLILAKTGNPILIFTPFKKRWLETYHHQSPSPFHAKELTKMEGKNNLKNILLDKKCLFDPPFERNVDLKWMAGEDEARSRLDEFTSNKDYLGRYWERRDYPVDENGTSKLSPFLAIGAISPRLCMDKVISSSSSPFNGKKGNGNEMKKGSESWINELIWREFYRHLLFHFPRLGEAATPFKSVNIPWRGWNHYPLQQKDNEENKDYDKSQENQDHNEAIRELQLWKSGKTGSPLVDAAMRCLNETGYLHNRLRMIVASYLAKELLIHWHLGEQYFMSQLIDGDYSNNNGGWQWSASTGTDSQPYFRMFNPQLQSIKYDPDALFIKKWVPELKELSSKDIHEGKIIKSFKDDHGNKIEKGDGIKNSYPERPIIDHKKARERALSIFRQAFKK